MTKKKRSASITSAMIVLGTIYAQVVFAEDQSQMPTVIDRELVQALGALEVFPFQDKAKALRCTTFHLGDGYMATAGHCFLGAYDCNGAKIRWANSSRISRCTNVIYSYASESIDLINSVSRDLTIFKVDAAPFQKLKLSPQVFRHEQVQSLNATGLGVKIERGRVVAASTGPCTLLTGRTTTIFGRPKPSDTVQHNCDVGNFGAGTPIVDAQTGELLAVQQSSSLMPAIDTASETYLKQIHYAKTFTDLELLKIIHSEVNTLRNVTIGGFSPEVFQNGFRERLSLKVVTLGTGVNTQSISFIPHTGVDTQMEIIDGDGRKTIISGPRRAHVEQKLDFKAPVEIHLKSVNTGMAPSLWLEDIVSE